MGYIAYAAGTLIAALAIHSFVTRKPNQETEILQTPITKLEAKAQETVSDSENEEETSPVVTIQVSHDDDHRAAQSSAAAQKNVQSADMVTSIPAQEQKAPSREPTTNGHISKPPTLSMPPPPRPNNLTTQARQSPTTTAMAPPRLKPATVSSLAPPARGRPVPTNSSLTPPPSTASTLRIPAQKTLTNTKMQPQSLATTSTQPPSKRSSRKVILSPGHSPLDWAALTQSSSPTSTRTLRGADASEALGDFRLGRITPSQLKKQNGRKGRDAWTVYHGRVYNVGAYLDFHPGGREELMKGAGRSSDGLFEEVHPWVNWEGMLAPCCVGLLVSEGEGDEEMKKEGVENVLDEMD